MQRHRFTDKGPCSQSYDFSSSHVQMWKLNHREDSAKELMLSNCGAGEDSQESLGQQGDQTSQSCRKSTRNIHWKDWYWSWGPNIWPPGVNSWFIGKDPDAGKYWRQKEKGVTEDETFGGHHQINGHEYEQTLGDNEGQGSLVCCSPCGCKDFNTTERLNNNNNNNFCNIRGCRNFKFLWTLVETENNLLLNTAVVIWQEMET